MRVSGPGAHLIILGPWDPDPTSKIWSSGFYQNSLGSKILGLTFFSMPKEYIHLLLAFSNIFFIGYNVNFGQSQYFYKVRLEKDGGELRYQQPKVKSVTRNSGQTLHLLIQNFIEMSHNKVSTIEQWNKKDKIMFLVFFCYEKLQTGNRYKVAQTELFVTKTKQKAKQAAK